jgi:hypothetical protein
LNEKAVMYVLVEQNDSILCIVYSTEKNATTEQAIFQQQISVRQLTF